MENPPTPFVGPIRGGFNDGKLIRIQGYTSPIAERFNVNLQTGSDDTADIALHISIRLTEGYVARNSQKDGEWGDEQGDGELPIGPSQKFEIIVLCATNDYKVAINGKHFCEFPQRIPPLSISHLAIDGDVSLSLISFEGGENRSSASSQESSRDQYGPPQGQYGPPQGHYGPPQGQYGPPQGQYGPPQGQYGGYPGGYGAPPPPPGQQGKENGFESFLDTAGSVIAGAISSGMADKLLSSLTSGGNQQNQNQNNPQQQYQQYPQNPPQQQQQPNFGLPQLGGQGSLGGLGSVGSLLSGFADQILQPKRDGHH